MMKFFAKLKNSKKGFAMLFTVLVISIILTIALGISDTTFKQTVLSGLAADSQLAFYQADSGVECGMYWETQGQFPSGTTPRGEDSNGNSSAGAATGLQCGNVNLTLDLQNSYTDYLVYKEDSDDSQPCFGITFDQATDPTITTVSSRGYSTCGMSARQVERGLSVSYSNAGTATVGTDPNAGANTTPQQ